MSSRKACPLAQFSRSRYCRKSRAKDQRALQRGIREIADVRPRFGFQRIHVTLRREGWHVNRKRVRRLYRREGLQIRMRMRRRKHMCMHRGPAPEPSAPGERWGMEFMHDQPFEGRPFRMLTIVNQLSLDSPLIDVEFSLTGHEVPAAL